jgi:hypothetical protein
MRMGCTAQHGDASERKLPVFMQVLQLLFREALRTHTQERAIPTDTRTDTRFEGPKISNYGCDLFWAIWRYVFAVSFCVSSITIFQYLRAWSLT